MGSAIAMTNVYLEFQSIDGIVGHDSGKSIFNLWWPNLEDQRCDQHSPKQDVARRDARRREALGQMPCMRFSQSAKAYSMRQVGKLSRNETTAGCSGERRLEGSV